MTINVLANDSDPEGGALTVTGVELSTRRTAPRRATPNNTITYTPDPNYNGPDSFTYEACDPAGLCDAATVNVTVTSSRPAGRPG